MKISLTPKEMLAMVRKSFPTELVPDGYEIVGDVTTTGYPIKEYTIAIEPKEEKEN